MSLFWRKRSIQIQAKVVNDQKPSGEPTEARDILEGVLVAERYAEIVKDVVTHTALTVGGVYIACQIVRRICK